MVLDAGVGEQRVEVDYRVCSECDKRNVVRERITKAQWDYV